MYIYKITQYWDTGYDTVLGQVIVANSPDECRLIATNNHGDEMGKTWADKIKSKIELLGNYTGKRKKPFLVIQEDKYI